MLWTFVPPPQVLPVTHSRCQDTGPAEHAPCASLTETSAVEPTVRMLTQTVEGAATRLLPVPILSLSLEYSLPASDLGQYHSLASIPWRQGSHYLHHGCDK